MNIMWRGRMVYDVSRNEPDRNICVRGIILWTLHDLAGEKTLNQKLLNQRVRQLNVQFSAKMIR